MINVEEYEKALSRITELMEIDSEHTPEESTELENLVVAVEAYEDTHYPIAEPGVKELTVGREQKRRIIQKIRDWKTKKTKWKSRRLVIGAIWAGGLNFAFYWCVAKGLDVEWFKSYIGYFTLGVMFFGGYLTATDMIDKWKK